MKHSQPEWHAALWLLESSLLINKGLSRWLDPIYQRIDFRAMVRAARPWSSSEQLMIRAAWDLFNGGAQLGLHASIVTFDDQNWQRLMEAVQIRLGKPIP